MTLLDTPIGELLKNGLLAQALEEKEQKCNATWEANKTYTRQHTGGFFVISDSLDGVLNPADGKRYDSKSAYHKTLKAKGLEIDDRKHVEYRPPEVKINERAFDAAFKKTMEQFNV